MSLQQSEQHWIQPFRNMCLQKCNVFGNNLMHTIYAIHIKYLVTSYPVQLWKQMCAQQFHSTIDLSVKLKGVNYYYQPPEEEQLTILLLQNSAIDGT